MNNIDEKELSRFRPLPFYYITTHDPSELTYERFYADLSDMKSKGYGGIVLFNRPPEGFSRELYFTEAWFDMAGNCIRACAALGLRVWINDDYDAPPGDIGGRLEKIAPHLKPLRLVFDGDEVKAVEAGWGFPAFEEEESALLFQKYVYEEYKRRFGEYFGSCIKGFFSDADSRRVNSMVYSPGSPMRDYFPWSKGFAGSFKAKYGYDILPFLPSVMRREPSDEAHDYWEHSGYLYMTWFRSNYEWCKRNGMEYTFHTSDSAPFPIETTPFNSAFAEGKAIDAGVNCDWPGVDHECLDLNGGRLFLRDRYKMSAAIYGGDDSLRRTANFYDVYADVRAKQAQSCAFLHDKKGVMCEMFAAANWNASYKDLRNIASWQIMQGVNFIVYQAYHYRLHGSTKNFAPLTFGPHSHTEFAMRDFNDSLTREAYMCSLGSLSADIALLDSTDYIWAKTGDSEIQLELAKTLNHYPQGYIISDIKGLELKFGKLKAVINPGLPLTNADRERIGSLGLKLYECGELDRLARELPTNVEWKGEGSLMFMRRALESGEELLIAANIESDDTLSGVLSYAGRDYEIELASGELAYFGGGYESYSKPERGKKQLYLDGEAAVSFKNANIIPLMRWEDEGGRAFSLIDLPNRVSFIIGDKWVPPHFDALNEPPAQCPLLPFKAEKELRGLELLASERFSANLNGVYIDGNMIPRAEDTWIFDDPYRVYRFDCEKGEHVIKLDRSSAVSYEDIVYLRGAFDADIKISGDKLYYGGAHAVQLYLPERADITLSDRRGTLKTGESWTEQGQPFYSGEATYSFEADIPDNAENAALVLSGLRDAAKVYIDGAYAGCAIYPPFMLPLEIKGRHRVDVTVCNTLGNQLEGYRAPSGITGKPYIEYTARG